MKAWFRSVTLIGCLALASPAIAVETGLGVTPGSGANLAGVVDLLGYWNLYHQICSGAAGATPTCATVNGSNQLTIAGPVTEVAGGFVDLGNSTSVSPSCTGNLINCTAQLHVDMTGATPAGTNNIGYMSLSPGAAAIAPAQVSVTSAATSIAAARTGVPGTGRVSVTITNTTTTAIYIGGSGVTTSTGALLPGIVGASLTLNTTAAVYGIVATGSATVTEIETY